MSRIVQVLFAPALLLSVLSSPANAADHTLRIYRYSAFNSVSAVSTNKAATTASGDISRGRTQVNVNGKRLTLNLQDNTRLIDHLPQADSELAVLSGSLEGKTGSWVRMTKTSEGTHGLIWDGAELYVVEPSNTVRNALAASLPDPESAAVIFKLSDTTLDLGTEYCGSELHSNTEASHTGLATYQALTTELSEQLTSSSGTPTLRLEMQALGDAAFRAQYDSDQTALEAILVRLNNVDGIFTAQMGLEVQATDVQIYGADPGSLSQSTDAGTLLSSLGQLRKNNPVMGTYGATHLFTGRDLDGDTLGIAYIGNICGARYGASLSEIRNRGAWIDSLVAAHELGHQLGAVHDGTGACGGTPAQSYLMGAQINGSSELSQCSRESIFATMQYAACLVPVGAPDVSLSVNSAPPQAEPNTSFHWSLPIRNLGTGAADRPSVHITVPASLVVESSAIAGGSCVTLNNADGGTVDCMFDSLAANEIRMLDLVLRADNAGSYQVSADVATAGDDNLLNNNAIYYLTIGNSDIAVGNAASSAEPAGSNSGGGAISALWLLALSALAGRRHLRQHAI